MWGGGGGRCTPPQTADRQQHDEKTTKKQRRTKLLALFLHLFFHVTISHNGKADLTIHHLRDLGEDLREVVRLLLRREAADVQDKRELGGAAREARAHRVAVGRARKRRSVAA